MNPKKLRMLWLSFHPTLREFEVPLLIKAGFEVIPHKPTQEVINYFNLPSDLEDDSSATNQLWRTSHSLPQDVAEQIRAIDFFDLFDMHGKQKHPFDRTGAGIPRIEYRHLINEWIDIVLVASYPVVVANILDWFRGISIFRLYGNENQSFRVLDWYIESFPLGGLSNFITYRRKYVALPILSGIKEVEDDFFVPSDSPVLESMVQPFNENIGKWNFQAAKPLAVTNISYLDCSESWKKKYKIFCESFVDVDFEIVGRNNTEKLDFIDSRIKQFIPEYQTFIGKLKEYRVFCSVGDSIQHAQYSHVEALQLGMPVLFILNSGFGFEVAKHFTQNELHDLGCCGDYSEMAKRAKELIENGNKANDLVVRQKDLLNQVFNRERLLAQAKALYGIIEDRLRGLPEDNKFQEVTPIPIMYWGPVHNTLAREEVPLFIQAGFGVIPADRNCNRLDSVEHLPKALVNRIREIALIVQPEQNLDTAFKPSQIRLLNEFVDVIIPPDASVNSVLALLLSGYRGVVGLRYFGHYHSGWSRTKHCQEISLDYRPLQFFPNYCWLPGLCTLSEIEEPMIARDGNRFYLQGAREEKLPKWEWEASERRIVTVIPLAHSELRHYYNNFKFYFGHLPHIILGRNSNLEKDPHIVGHISSSEDYFDKLRRSRVYIECGFVRQHSHYTPVEAVKIGIPVLFHSSCGFAAEVGQRIPKKRLYQLGMFDSFEEMERVAITLLYQKEMAVALSEAQVILFTQGYDIVEISAQYKKFFNFVCENRDNPTTVDLEKVKSFSISKLQMENKLRKRNALTNKIILHVKLELAKVPFLVFGFKVARKFYRYILALVMRKIKK